MPCIEKRLCLISVVLSMALAMSTADGGQFEDLGVPVHKAALMETIIGPDRTGTRDMVYMNFVQGAGAAFVLAVDPETGESRQYGVKNDISSSALCLGPDGKIYMGTIGQALILCFDPAQPEMGFKTIGRPSGTETYLWRLCVGKKDGKIYGGSYPSAKLVSYDPATDRLEDLGRMDDLQDYTNFVAPGRNGKIYTGIGSARRNLVVYDPETRTHRSLLTENQRVPGFVEVVEGADGNVYAKMSGGEGGVFRMDDETLVRVPTVPRKPLTLRDGRVISDIVEVTGGGSFTVENPTTHEKKIVSFSYEGAGSTIFFVGVGPEGCIYGSTAQPLEVFRYDPRMNKSTHLGNMPGGEVYSMIEHHGLLYLCYYGGSTMNLYDPQKPFWKYGTGADCNPRSFGSLGDGHQRPRAMIHGPNERIYVGSHPSYGQLGGAMAAWDPTQNKVIANYRHLVQDQSIVALAYEPKSGLIFGGSGNFGGNGTRPTQKEAVFFAFDPETKRKLYEMPLVPGAQTYPAMVAAEGKIFLALDQLYVFDPSTKEIIHRAPLPAGSQLDISLGLHSDGLIYGLTSQWIYSVNPRTYAIQEVAKLPAPWPPIFRGFALTDTGIYFGSGVHLWRYRW
jgi:outer membrane protein assembly factor BamB